MRSYVDVAGDVIVYISCYQFRHHGAMTPVSQHHQLLALIKSARDLFVTMLHMCLFSKSRSRPTGAKVLMMSERSKSSDVATLTLWRIV